MVVKSIEAFTSKRKLPKNFKDKDLKLFENALTYKNNNSNILLINKVYLLYKVLFKIKGFEFYDEYCFVHKTKKFKLFSYLFFLFNKKKEIPKGVWITDNWSKEYFHWFTDALPRYKAAEELIREHKVIIPYNFLKHKFIIESLEILKIEFYPSDTKKLFVNEMILPSHTARTGNFNPKFLNQLRNSFTNIKQVVNPQKNIYISRDKAIKRKIINENEIILILNKFNFEIHFFEEYTLKKQIEIMNNAKCLISIHGAGLTNMIFMPIKGKILELRNQGDNENNCFFSMASDLDHDYYYLECNGDDKDTNISNLNVDLNEFEKVLNELQ